MPFLATVKRGAITLSYASLLAIATVPVVVLLLLNFITFMFGVLVGLRAKTKQASTTVSAAHSEADASAISETVPAGVELERLHDYEDVVIYSEPNADVNTFTDNVAYGCS